MNILVPNLGSTSLKFQILNMPAETQLAARKIERVRDYRDAITQIEAAGVARYGFHGASHQYVAERATAMLGRPLRLVSCHLGGSSSMCAIDRGRSIDTTMGFSPQSGLENASRHGDLDVFAALFMMERNAWTIDDVRSQLAREGGLAGLSGIAGGDVRDLEASATEWAHLALAVFSYQVKK